MVGGADGEPKLYRILRSSKRVIGDDANLIRKFPRLKGRVFDVAISHDGTRIAAGSCVDGTGDVGIYAYDFDSDLPEDLLKIMQKRVAQRSAEEKKKVEEYQTKDVKVLAKTDFTDVGIFAVAFSSDSKVVAAAGTDGTVRLINADDGSIVTKFVPVPVDSMADPADVQDAPVAAAPLREKADGPATDESLSVGEKVASIEVQPAGIRLAKRFDTGQFIVTGHLESGNVVDVTRLVRIEASSDIVDISPRGLLRGRANGRADVQFSLGDNQATATVDVSGVDPDFQVDLIRDVNPVFGKAGCNAGTCHGSKGGKGGLKVSMRGNDPIFEARAYIDELASRRINLASPDNSLMLLKATTTVPHQGGQVLVKGTPHYRTIRKWIADGVKIDVDAPRVASIEIFPRDRILQRTDARQQYRVLATYTDGEVRDVTSESHISSGNIEVATADRTGLGHRAATR